MKKLYQSKIKTELLVPTELSRDEFISLVGGEENLKSEINILTSSESEEDAIIDALYRYAESSIGMVEDYLGILSRGENRNKYYLGVSLEKDGKKIYTRATISIYPQDLGI